MDVDVTNAAGTTPVNCTAPSHALQSTSRSSCLHLIGDDYYDGAGEGGEGKEGLRHGKQRS